MRNDAIRAVGISVNEMDSNYEAANLVDGLFAISRAIRCLAKAVEQRGGDPTDTGKRDIVTVPVVEEEGETC